MNTIVKRKSVNDETDPVQLRVNYELALQQAAGGQEVLEKLIGQQLRDIWHGLVGKKMGLGGSRGGSGLGSKSELIAAILARVDSGSNAAGGGPKPKPKAKAKAEGAVREMAKCFTHGQRIRHAGTCPNTWVGTYDSARDGIVHDGTLHASMSAFVQAHLRKDRPDLVPSANGWKWCECEVGGAWVSTFSLPSLGPFPAPAAAGGSGAAAGGSGAAAGGSGAAAGGSGAAAGGSGPLPLLMPPTHSADGPVIDLTSCDHPCLVAKLAAAEAKLAAVEAKLAAVQSLLTA